uniref:Zn(2)-C6 fungal-type domain-containing protein n=1 Tax=Ganoderma boninense TaxID=34458 RepID=A0A5K1JWQ4_9APHY|nr:Zn(2)-C6 fungal-type domain-containing protein [Ganoderma boninense]
MITLAQVIEEVVSNGLSIRPTSYAAVLETDKKLQVWHSTLHPSLDWRRPHATSKNPSPQERDVFYQRHTSASYFLGALMNLHRPYLMREPPILPLPGRSVVQNPSRERCIDAAMELVRILCDAHEEAARWGVGAGGGEQQVSAVLFHYAYCAFDGTVALVGALSQDPPYPRAEECLALIYRATRMLEDIKLAHDLDAARRGEANIAARAITILAALRKAGRWDERFGRRDGTPLACSLAEPHVAAPASSCSPVSEIPGNLHEPGGLMLGGYPFDPAQFSGPGFDAHAQPATSAIPFLNTGGHAPVLSPFAGLQSAVMNQDTERPGDLLDLGIYASLMAPLQMDPSWSRGAAHSMAMPFEMLQSSENDIDWGAVLNSTSDGGAGMNWSIG